MKSPRSNIGVVVALGVFLVMAVENMAAEQNAPIGPNFAIGEEKSALEGLLSENLALRETLFESKRSLAESITSLAMAREEGKVFRRLNLDLTLRMEALGVDVALGDQKRLEQRLLASVRDLQSLAEERKQLSEALIRVTEAASAYLGTAPVAVPEARLAIESELRHAGSLLAVKREAKYSRTAASPTLAAGVAIGIKDELSLVVMNLGLRNDISLGMPFDVFRGSKLIGAIRVVDVREYIAGAVIQQLASDETKIQVGDNIKAGFRN